MNKYNYNKNHTIIATNIRMRNILEMMRDEKNERKEREVVNARSSKCYHFRSHKWHIILNMNYIYCSRFGSVVSFYKVYLFDHREYREKKSEQ